MAEWQRIEPLNELQTIWKVRYGDWVGVVQGISFPADKRAAVEADIQKSSVERLHCVMCREPAYEQLDQETGFVRVLYDFCAGGSVAKTVIKKSLELEPTVLTRLISETTKALFELHETGVCHGHFKASRVLLTSEHVETAEVKLLLFGGSNTRGAEEIADDVTVAKHYAPEALSGRLTTASDVWALGLFAFELFTSQNPFVSDGDSVETLRQKQKEDVDFSPYIHIPPSVQDFISECLTYDANRRPAVRHLLGMPLDVRYPLEAELAIALEKNRLTTVESLGKGGSGEVWKVKYEPLDWTGALKIIPYRSDVEEKYIERELANMPKLNNIPYIVKYFHHITRKSLGSKILMEFCLGKDLFNSVIQPKLAVPNEVKVKWIKQLTETIAFMHKKGYIHRDIKSLNILLTNTDPLQADIKLCDFGVSKFTGQAVVVGQMNTPSMGTHWSFAPEQWGKFYDGRVDVWALGVVAFELFLNHNPFIPPNTPDSQKCDSLVIENQKKLQNDTFDWTSLRLPRNLEDFLKKCFTYDHTQRPGADELLRHPLFTEPLPTFDPDQPLPPPPPPPIPPSSALDSALDSARDSALNLARRAIEHLRVVNVVGAREAYYLATSYHNFHKANISNLKRNAPESWSRDMEGLEKELKTFVKPS